MRHGALRSILVALALVGLLATPQPAQAKFWQFAYENYPDVDWLVLETDHFRIYYYPEIEWTARMMAKYAEIAYPKVTGLFDYPLKEKIHIVIRDQEENANGFAAYGSDWVTAWATPLYFPIRGRQEWIPDMFAHEFTHIVSLKVNDWKSESAWIFLGSGLIEDGVHNIDFGARVLIGFASPYWWTEGVAEYGDHLAGFNWWTTSRDMHLRAAVLEDNVLTFDEMFTPGNKDTSFDREKGYQQGYSMALYVMEKYGKEQYAQLAVNSNREGHLVWEKNIEDVLGIEGHKLYDNYLKWMRDRYERQVAPILKAEHIGRQLLISSPAEELKILEKLPDGRVKVEKGKPVLKRALAFDSEEAEAFLEKRTGDVEALEDEALKAAGERYLEALRAKVAAFDKAEQEFDEKIEAQEDLSEVDELRQRMELAQQFFSGQEKPSDPGLAAAFDKADAKREKPKIEYWDKRQRKYYYEKGAGSWDMIPRVSPDGKWTAYAGRRGVVLMPLTGSDWPAFSGRYLSGALEGQVASLTKLVPGSSVFNGYEFSPDGKKVIYSTLRCPDTWLPCVNLDNYYRYDLFEYDIETEDVEKLSHRLRAVTPAYSPDGQNIAFVHIEDGQNWLGVFPADAREVSPDGKCVIDGQPREKCIKWLIYKHDGTQIGQPYFSADGKQLVFDLYRNQQQDIWMINADGTNLHPLTWDRAEDRDGRFTPDGKGIIYSSDRSGIFNVYRMDLASREVKQVTNVINGAYTPFLTKDGDLMYSYFSSYGFKIYALKKEDFYNKVIDAGYEVSPEEVARNLAYQEPLPEIREKSTSYNAFNPKNWPPISGVPLLIYERQGINVGGFVTTEDILAKHAAFAQVLLGATSDYRVFYINNMWYPQFILGFVHVDFGGEFSQGFNTSQMVNSRAEPHFDQPLTYKYHQSVDFGMAGISYDLGPLELDASYLYRYYTSQTRSDTKNDAFLTNNSYSLGAVFNGLSPYGTEADINPRGGRRINLEYIFTRTGLPEKQWADVEWLGRRNPPGDHSDDYTFHQIEVGYTEALPISWWNPVGQHTLELHLRGGWINRNVMTWDEFFAGSLHPLRYVPTQSTSHEFAGYEDFSLNGETMLILGLAYRFPIYRHIDRKFGPFYFASVWGELFGTAGNLWGYTGEYVRDKFGNIQRNSESYWDPKIKRGTVRREIPFVDIASKNGNYMLYDIGFTLKLKAFLFGYISWNSFFRVAYGFNDIVGSGEVNDDRVYVDIYPNNASIAESEPKSVRVSIGIGSDFD